MKTIKPMCLLSYLRIGFIVENKLRFFLVEMVEEAIVDSLLVDIFTHFNFKG